MGKSIPSIYRGESDAFGFAIAHCPVCNIGMIGPKPDIESAHDVVVGHVLVQHPAYVESIPSDRSHVTKPTRKSTWVDMSTDDLLDIEVRMEEERYLRTVKSYLDMTGIMSEVEDPGHGFGWAITFPGHDFYVSSGGIDNGFNLQIVSPIKSGDFEYIAVPWGRPVTAAYIILDHYKSVTS